MKDAVLPIRLTGDQRVVLQQAAARAGNTVLGVVRHAAICQAEREQNRERELERARELLRAGGRPDLAAQV